MIFSSLRLRASARVNSLEFLFGRRSEGFHDLAWISRLIVVPAIAFFPAEGFSASNSEVGPQIFVDAPVHDFGVARQQQRLEHSFSIQNRGKGALVIEDVRSTCDCTTEDIQKRRIPAGSAIPLEVVLKTRSYQGTLKRAIELHTNDPQSPVLQLEVMARVCTNFVIEPRSLLLKRIAGKSLFEGELRLIQCNDQPLSLTGVDASAPWLESSWERVSEEGGEGYVIRVWAKETLPVGHHAAVLSVHVDHEGPSVIDVPVILRAGSEVPNGIPGE